MSQTLVRSLLFACLILIHNSVFAGGATFSVDYQGPTAGGVPGPNTGVKDSFTSTEIDEGSILTTARPGPPGPNVPVFGGPLRPPGMMIDASIGGAGGTVPGGLGILPTGPFDAVELDALSYGRDDRMGMIFFSVDEWASGAQALGAALGAPNVFTEGVGAGGGPAYEASADVFKYGRSAAPFSGVFPAVVPGNMAVYDGDAMAGAGPTPNKGPGFGLIEPNPPSSGTPDRGDNLDALDKNSTLEDVRGYVFFSMDARFPDPLEVVLGTPPNTGTAIANGFLGSDVVVNTAGSGVAPTLYAPAAALGLTADDDLDALVLKDDGALNPNTDMPFFRPGADFILFSVRRGSGVIGMADSKFGLRIEEGDILTVPTAPGATPAIYLPAEMMALGTLRSGTAGQFGADDLDALDLFFHLFGDANGDRKVTGLDLIEIQQNFGKAGAMDGMLPGDANNDGKVSGRDLIATQQNFGKAAGGDSPVAVPEPATTACLAIGLLLIGSGGRLRPDPSAAGRN